MGDKLETEQRRMMRKELIQKALDDSLAANARRNAELKSKADMEEAQVKEHDERIQARDRQIKQDTWEKVVVKRQQLETAASTRYKAEREMLDETECKATKERAVKDARDIENERKKSARLKDERHSTQEYLLEQMRKKTR